MFKSEESKIGLVMLLTGMVTVVTTLITATDKEPYIVPVIVGGTAAVFVAIVLYGLYQARVKGRKAEVQDERSALYSLKSARNGFIVAMLALAAYMVIGGLGAPLNEIGALQAIWGLSFAAYAISYLYYKKMA